jgi:hypothetical protein
MKRRTAGIAVVGGVRRATLVVLVALVLVILLALGCTSDQRASNQRTSDQRASNQRTSVELLR